MLVLITYDVCTESEGGKKRLRKVAKACQNYGQRVQESVFECLIDPSRMRQLQANLENLIDKDKDSLRFYYLGDEWRGKVEHVGTKKPMDLKGTLVV